MAQRRTRDASLGTAHHPDHVGHDADVDRRCRRGCPQELAMALTLSRWIAATVLGCAALTTGAIVRDGRERDKRVVVRPSTESAVLGSARDRYGDAHRRWRALARRDSILIARGTRHARHSTPMVQVSGGLGGETRTAVERIVLRQWHALRIDSARTPTTIAVVREWEPDSAMAG